MPPYRKIKRNYSKPFFSNRRRGLAGMPLLLTFLSVLATIGGLLVVAWVFRVDVTMAVDEFMGTPRPTATLPANQYAQRGFGAFLDGQLKSAREDFDRALDQRPDDINYLYEYGQILIELDDYDMAVAIGDHAIEVADSDARGYALKARALMWSDPASAIPVAVSGLEHDPDFAHLHAALAVAYTNIGRYAEGLQRGIHATELDPLNAFAHQRLLHSTNLYRPE